MNGQFDPQQHEWAGHERVIVFDGACNWCNAWVNFTLARDPHAKFKFGTLQSEPAQQILKALRLPADDFETFLLLERGRVFTKSTAALRMVRQLPGLWPLLYAGIVIPRPLRDALYDYVARRRYHWMGKSDICRVPTPAEHERFV
ncbi:MAG: thiol-disulfide oxidoreductase DCC family protein [Nitrospira sp.]|nr:thiol-disulfide oxidoreductase DCC family protein [Nitrospira sp.]